MYFIFRFPSTAPSQHFPIKCLILQSSPRAQALSHLALSLFLIDGSLGLFLKASLVAAEKEQHLGYCCCPFHTGKYCRDLAFYTPWGHVTSAEKRSTVSSLTQSIGPLHLQVLPGEPLSDFQTDFSVLSSCLLFYFSSRHFYQVPKSNSLLFSLLGIFFC